MRDLPTWPGANSVYARVYLINEKLCRAAYKAQRSNWKLKTGFKFSVPEDVQASIKALGEGNEEALKAYFATHIKLLSLQDLISTREYEFSPQYYR